MERPRRNDVIAMGLLYCVDLVYCHTSNDSHTWIAVS